MKTSKKIISLLMCMLMVLTMVPMSVFATEATEIDTINIEGVLAPQYGQTVEDHFDDMIKKGDDGEFKVNGLGYYVCDLFEEMEFSLLDKDKKMLDKSEVIVEGTYYFAMTLYPAVGYVIPDDAAVTVDGAVSVEKDFDEYGVLTVYAKYEVEAPAPTEIGTVQIEGIPVPLYGQTVKEYNTVMYNGSMNGIHKINGSTRVDNSGHINYGNIELSDWEYYNSEKNYIAPSSADALPSVYYLVHWLYPAAGYKFADEAEVTVDGAVSVETELDEEGCLAVWAKFEVKPTEIDTVNLTYDLDYIDLNTFYKESNVTTRVGETLKTDTAGVKFNTGSCCVSYIDSYGDFYNCTYNKEIIAEKDYYVRAILLLEDGYDWPAAAKTDEPSGLKIISNGTDVSDAVYIKYNSYANSIFVYEKIGKPSTEQIIANVSISDGAIMLDKGESHSFIAYVNGNADDKTVTWTVEGAVSANTTVDSMGKLTIGADETADEITVKATSNYNSKKFVTAEVKIGTPTEIDTVNIEGVPAPQYGQTIKSYYESVEAKITDGTITVNDEVYDSTAYKYGNLLDDGWNVRSEADGYLSSTSTDLIKEGTYYVAMWFLPDNGYVIPEDVNVLFDGAKSVKIEVESDGCLDIRAEYEVVPTIIDTIHIEDFVAPQYGETPNQFWEDYNNIKVNGNSWSTDLKFGNICEDGIDIHRYGESGIDASVPFSAGTYEAVFWFVADSGCEFASDLNVTIDGVDSDDISVVPAEDGWIKICVLCEVKCPHAYDNACDATCNKCESTRTPAAHKGGTATCTDKAKCSVCGEAYGSVNKNNHKSITTLKAEAATYITAGKTEGKKCTVCGTVTVPQKVVAKKVLGKVTGLKTKTVKLASGTKTTLTLAWTKVADAQKYEIYQQSGKKWKKIGTTSKTTLTVKKLKANKFYKFKVRAIRSDAKGAYSSVFTGKTVPLTPAVTLKADKKALTASWKTVANITGYEVQASTSKKFTSKTTKKVTITKAKTTKTTIKKLSKGKKYYVKVRAYKTVDGKKVYGAWSAVKSVKVK